MLIGIYTNPLRDCGLSATKKLSALLEKKGVGFAVHESVGRFRSDVATFGDACDPCPDVLITLGGDGTILSAVAFAAEKKIPVLGINLGRIGFLSEYSVDRLEECVDRLVRGDYTVRSRSMLETTTGGRKIVALNDFAFYKRNVGKTVILTVKVDGAVYGNFKCDGFLVSTPTGSTAYALSAGGPIVSPNVRCNLLVPINCHHLASKPVVIDENAVVEIYGDEPACVIADGRVEVDDSKGIAVRKSPLTAPFVCMDDGNFFAKLHEKLGGAVKEGL